jgi:glyoxylase-like metal-dependent hydrolase (beta-lactamase superfamily II)
MRRFRTWGTLRFDQNVGLVLGERGPVVIDARGSHRRASRVLQELRAITRQPVFAVVNTHHHWDHTFGNAMFRPAPIWGHDNNARHFLERGERRRQQVSEIEPRLADELAEVILTPPDRTFARRTSIDLGDRVVHLRHPGRGHTDNDVVVDVPDASVVFAGDLLVEGTAPGFNDAYPIAWARLLSGLERDITRGAVVPGHGGALAASDIGSRRAQMEAMVRLGRAVLRGEISEDAAARQSPFPRAPSLQAIARIRVEAG